VEIPREVTPALPAAIRETHSAVVVFIGDRAYKVKKPVDLGFLDFRTREAREAVCHLEVDLNRRLSPDVYLGVADVVGPDGTVSDHLVVMRRMPEDRRLSTLVLAGAPVEAELRRIAHVMAVFHAAADAPEAARVAAGRSALAARWEANLEVMERAAGSVLDDAAVARVALLARRYLAGRGPLLQARLDAGRARDGHGDLLADDVFCLPDGPRILDCIEFDEELRYGDVLADVAFLAMDLERLGRPDLGTLFLATYRELTGDAWPASLAHHHVAYRAGVRAKVTCIRHEQATGAARAAARDEAQQLLALTGRHLEAGRVRLVVVGGLPAMGKSTVAAGVADALGAVHLRSDEVRKELAGLPASTSAAAPVGEGIYDERATTATYQALLERAGTLLGLGESVVLDATFHAPRWRSAAARLAETTVADLTELRCVAPMEVAVARAARRSMAATDMSDADETVVRAMADTEAAWPSATTIDTNAAPDAGISAAVAAVERAR
jgi:aminoglycoside phosphotransferase family enzyme